MDQAGEVPWRHVLCTVGHDRAGPGIYLFGGICKEPHVAGVVGGEALVPDPLPLYRALL